MKVRKVTGPIRIPVSAAELLDKIGILRIKLKRFTDPEKRNNCRKELGLLTKIAKEHGCVFPMESEQLQRVNQRLWNIENRIRRKTQESAFDESFIEIAQKMFRTNEERAKLKRKINRKAHSVIVEEKEYVGYSDPE